MNSARPATATCGTAGANPGWLLVLLALAVWSAPPQLLWAARGELELRVTDAQTHEPVAVQFQLVNRQGRAVKLAGLARDGDWLVFDGQTVLKLPPGAYSFRMRRGLEYRERTGEFVIRSAAADNHEVDLPRFVQMSLEGWWSGDLQVQPDSLSQLETRILASDLHVVPVTCRSQPTGLRVTAEMAQRLQAAIGQQRIVQLTGACDRRRGSGVWLLAGGDLPELPAADQARPTPLNLAKAARQRGDGAAPLHVHLGHVTDGELPIWVAHGLVDTVGVLHDGLRENSSSDDPQDLARDRTLFPDPEGVGRWALQTYFRLLESGVRIPPAAGSGADASGNPLGYARVYVHCGDLFSPAAWWQGLRAGRVVVTNGPLLRPHVNGQLPGYVFRGQPGQPLQLEVELRLSTADKIRYLELIQNGRPVQQVRLEDWASRGGKLPPVIFEQSGWLLVRAVAEHPTAYRAALSGPYYVEFAGRPRISRQATQFFLDWVDQRARQPQAGSDAAQAQRSLELRQARDFWQQRLSAATVD